MRKNEDSKWQDIIGTIIILAIIGSIICGILECFSVSTGAIGVICCIIPILFLIVFVIMQILGELNK